MARDLELERWLEEDSKRPESVALEWWNWAWTLTGYARKIIQRLGSIFEDLGKEGCPTKEQLARIRKNVESGEFWFQAFKEPLDMFDKKVEVMEEYSGEEEERDGEGDGRGGSGGREGLLGDRAGDSQENAVGE